MALIFMCTYGLGKNRIGTSKCRPLIYVHNSAYVCVGCSPIASFLADPQHMMCRAHNDCWNDAWTTDWGMMHNEYNMIMTARSSFVYVATICMVWNLDLT